MYILHPNIESKHAELIKNYTVFMYIPTTCTFFGKKKHLAGQLLTSISSTFPAF